VDKIIQRAKDIYKSRKMGIFALLAVLLLVPIWVLKSLRPGSVGDYQNKALPFETNHFTAYDINNKGQIIASARASGSTRSYLMTPAGLDQRGPKPIPPAVPGN